jgi:hypothetical protein
VDDTLTVLDCLIEAGAPVALWSRPPGEPGDEFDTPAGWRERVLEHRSNSSSRLDLTLLWDDPDSVPGRRWRRSQPFSDAGLRTG